MMTLGDSPVRVALLGCGVVGSQVARILIEQADDLRARVGRPLELEFADDGSSPAAVRSHPCTG